MLYRKPMLVASMLVGIALYVALFSVVFATAFFDPNTRWGRYGARIKKGVRIKLGILLPLAVLSFLLSYLLKGPLLFFLGMLFSDAFTGNLSASLLERNVSVGSPAGILLTTLVQGAFITLELVLLSFIPLIRECLQRREQKPKSH